MKKALIAILALLLILPVISLSGCGSEDTPDDTPSSVGGDTNAVGDKTASGAWGGLTEDQIAAKYGAGCVFVSLKNTTAEINGEGAVLNGSVITVNKAGVYVFAGTLDDGRIIVAADKTDEVTLVLCGVSISCSTESAIYVDSADKTYIATLLGTENTISDSGAYSADTAETKAAIYGDDDITFSGDGTLTVNGNRNNGIATKNDLRFEGGTVTVNAVNNGLKGKDSVEVTGGIVTVISQDDGIKCDNDVDEGEGYFYMEGGTLNITAVDDGITAITSVVVTGGKITTSVGDKAVNCDGMVDIATGSLTEN